MCKCCQLCWEDLYWSCIEEKFCYDESIANYDPAEDEYPQKNGHITSNGDSMENGGLPITTQPTRLQRNISMNSAKIHENDVKREIQTSGVNLAPEILQVFANSQIFHDHKPLVKQSTSPLPATFQIGATKIEQANEAGSKKLLDRLDEEDKLSPLKEPTRGKRVLTTPPRIIETPAIDEESGEDEDDEVILRPRQLQPVPSSEQIWPGKLVNKNLKNLDAPYFTQRPASENDIFTISTPSKNDGRPNVSSTSDVNRFSMTPEVPSIAFAHLPKNYAETPTVEKYKKEGPSLLEIQTAEIRNSMSDFSMPRYYGFGRNGKSNGKSDMILNRSFEAVGSTTSIASASGGSSSSLQTRKHNDKSKRLKNFRTHLPPLTIHSKDKNEKEK